MELRHVRYFLAVAEELNFRRAAERINITQPSLSEQIRQLESEVGARLLERDTHRVSLTAAGRSFLESSRRLLREAEESARDARRIGRGQAGLLSIGYVPSLGHGLLPTILRAYRGKFPDVELRLAEMDTAQQIAELNAHRLDLGFIGLGFPSHEIPDLELATIREEQLMAVLPQDHPLAKRSKRPLRLAALAKERFLLGDRQTAPVYNLWLGVLFQQAGFQAHVVQELGLPTTVLNYVAAGLGITILPAQFSRLPTLGVRFMPLARPVPRYRYCAAWSPRNPHSSLVHFVETARQEGRKLKF